MDRSCRSADGIPLRPTPASCGRVLVGGAATSLPSSRICRGGRGSPRPGSARTGLDEKAFVSAPPTSHSGVLALNTILAASAFELALREHFHQLSAEVFHVAVLIALLLVLNGVHYALHRLRPKGWFGAIGTRVPMLCALAFTIQILIGGHVTATLASLPNAPVWESLAVATGIAVAGLTLFLPSASWGALQRTAALLSVLFVIAQPLLAGFAARPHTWPPISSNQPTSAGKMQIGDHLSVARRTEFFECAALH